jgi:hypothetical protein
LIQAFVSSTYSDLKDHRAYVIDRLARSGVFVDPMERWTAASDEPKALSQDRVKDCDFCVLLVGFRRGHIPDGETRSITQLEYLEAERRGIDVLVFMASEEADWPADAVAGLKNDPEIVRWRAQLGEHKVVSFFTRQPESIDVDAALSRWQMKRWTARQRPDIDESQDAMSVDIRAYCNSDGVLIAWRTARPIEGCLGFALHRRVLGDAGVTEQVVRTRLGFADGQRVSGEPTPSTITPIQNFRWAERLDRQQEVRYRVVPMMGRSDALAEAADQHAGSGWTPWLSPRTGLRPGYRAYFNRAGPSQARLALGKGDDTEETLLRRLRCDGLAQRGSLGGGLRDELLTLLTGARQSAQRVYAALADLDDIDLVGTLKSLGKNLHLLLGPAPVRRGQNDDAAKRARATLRRELQHAGVYVDEQALRKTGSARSNFAVFCDKWGTPMTLWTGSTAWTTRALCLRSNNGLLIEQAALVRAYLDLWDELRDNAKRPGLPVHIRDSEMSITLWATPTPGGGDLRDVTRLIRGARQGIMFLIEGPRIAKNVMAEILQLLSDRDLFIEGVSWSRGNGNKAPVRCEYRVNDQVSIVGEPSSGPPFDGMTVLIDPFGPHPTILTGSHDLRAETSASNQSDLLIIENAPGLAAEYAVHLARLLASYRWRSTMAAARKPTLLSLQQTDKWQQHFFQGTRRSEFNFLFGSLSPGL